MLPRHHPLLVTPGVALPKLTKSLKGITAKRANARLALTGRPFWQEESYDHMVRNEPEFERIRDYIEENPVRAGLVQDAPANTDGRAWHRRPGGRLRTRGSALLCSSSRTYRYARLRSRGVLSASSSTSMSRTPSVRRNVPFGRGPCRLKGVADSSLIRAIQVVLLLGGSRRTAPCPRGVLARSSKTGVEPWRHACVSGVL